jgi:hypothetical protein
VGDWIVASGRADGTARAIAPETYRRATHGPIAGQAWSAKSAAGVGTVTVAVGLDQSGALAERLHEQNERMNKLEAENAQIKKRLARLEAQTTSASMRAGLASPGLLLGLLVGLGAVSVGAFWLGRRRGRLRLHT